MINGSPNCSVSADIDSSSVETSSFPFSLHACIRIPHLCFHLRKPEFTHTHAHSVHADAPCCRPLFQMMKHAWDSYRQYGWGHNELKPLAKKGHSTNIFGKSLAAAAGAGRRG